MEFILETENLTKRFGAVLANDSISISIRAGEIHCLLGENGAGKSTLAECVYGYYQPDSGRIYYRDEEVFLSSPSDAIRLGIGMVHQHFVLVPSMTVVENILVGIQSRGLLINRRDAELRIRGLCDPYGIDIDPRAKIWHLSFGQRQWVEILKALYLRVELLILDEPTAALTPQETEKLFSILKMMKADGLAVVFITHKLREVFEVSDRVSVLRKGRLIATRNTAEVTKEDLSQLMVGRKVLFRAEKKKLPRGKPILELKGLVAKDDREREALRGISLSVHQSEILGIAGVAGNGQRELYDVITGARAAESGRVVLEDIEITNLSPKKIMARGLRHIPADRIAEGLMLDFSIAENLIFGLQREDTFRRSIFLQQDAIQSFVRECIDQFGIVTPSPDQQAKTLSGGNLQKVILARELSQEPTVLIANRPTRGLDIGAIEYVHRRLLEQRERGVGILLFSEDLEEIFNLADRIAVIYQGMIQAIFEASEASIEEIGLLMAGGRRELA